MTTGILWFTRDLRLDDNPTLIQAAQACDQLLCVYLHDPALVKRQQFNSIRLGSKRQRFLAAGLKDLSEQLSSLGQNLVELDGDPVELLSSLISQLGVHCLFCARPNGCYETRQLDAIQQRFPHLRLSNPDSYTLFDRQDIAPVLEAFPPGFSRFRRKVENRACPAPLGRPKQLPPPPGVEIPQATPSAAVPSVFTHNDWFSGGELAAQAHLERYFTSALPLSYKEVRNALDGLDNGTRFSPWLAQGSLSPRRVLHALGQYEQTHGSNESTYWIFFELLWREYFQWYAEHHGHRLFHPQGIGSKPPLTSFYPQRFKSWCEGTTPWPLVNACMRQLKATGWMSNRGRQIVASCLVNELELDWRYGAAWFEQELIDYDMASNWGNWQYLAGVGADPRGKRHFDISKQTRQFDPEGLFIQHWEGNQPATPLHTVDAADWPVMPQDSSLH